MNTLATTANLSKEFVMAGIIHSKPALSMESNRDLRRTSYEGRIWSWAAAPQWGAEFGETYRPRLRRGAQAVASALPYLRPQGAELSNSSFGIRISYFQSFADGE